MPIPSYSSLRSFLLFILLPVLLAVGLVLTVTSAMSNHSLACAVSHSLVVALDKFAAENSGSYPQTLRDAEFQKYLDARMRILINKYTVLYIRPHDSAPRKTPVLIVSGVLGTTVYMKDGTGRSMREAAEADRLAIEP